MQAADSPGAFAAVSATATLAWDDFAGSSALDPREPVLVNDLDLVAISPSGVAHGPWIFVPPPLAEDPLAGIDPINVSEIRELVAHLKDRGLGVLITDHNVRDTLDIIDRAYILHEGRVLTEGAPGEIIAHEGVRRVYLGDRFSL